MRLIPVDRPQVPPRTMSDRFRTQIVYFMTPAGDRTAPSELGPKEYWIAREDAIRWLDECVIRVISPLDAASQAEIELSEEQESWLEWLVKHEIQHVRVE